MTLDSPAFQIICFISFILITFLIVLIFIFASDTAAILAIIPLLIAILIACMAYIGRDITNEDKSSGSSTEASIVNDNVIKDPSFIIGTGCPSPIDFI